MKIKSITVVTQIGVSSATVGKDGVTAIEDVSKYMERPGDRVYEVYKGDDLYRRIENCPVDIIFYNE